MLQRNVRVVADPVEVNTLNDEGNVTPLGLVHREEYEGENHIRYSFQLEGEDELKTIGTSKELLPIVDPAQALSPLLENGWKLQRQFGLNHGNGKYHVVMVPEATIGRIPDPIQWDHSLWGFKVTGDRAEDGVRYLQESLIIDGSLSPRQAFRFNRGLHRLICDNGMTHRMMEFGRVRVTHRAFDPNVLITNLGGFQTIGGDDERVLGPVFGQPESANRMATFIRRNFLNPDDADGPGMVTIPNFIKDASRTLEGFPKWYLGEYATQLQMMSDNISGRSIRGLDVLNAITNPMAIEQNK